MLVVRVLLGLAVATAVFVPLERWLRIRRQRVLRPGWRTDAVHFLATRFLTQGATIVVAAPFVVLARSLEPRARALRARYDTEVLAVEREAYAQIAQAVFATAGHRAYPDGTFTLRLSYGRVEGYREDGRPVPPFTEIRGLYVRADQHR